jgi:hypothetical protein
VVGVFEPLTGLDEILLEDDEEAMLHFDLVGGESG